MCIKVVIILPLHAPLVLVRSWSGDVPSAVQDGGQDHLVGEEQREDDGSGGETRSP